MPPGSNNPVLACRYVIVYVHHMLVVCHKAPISYDMCGVSYDMLGVTYSSCLRQKPLSECDKQSPL